MKNYLNKKVSKNEKGEEIVSWNVGVKYAEGKNGYMPVTFAKGVEAPADADLQNNSAFIAIKDFDFVAGKNGMKLNIKAYEIAQKNVDVPLDVTLNVKKSVFKNGEKDMTVYRVNRLLYNTKDDWKQIQIDFGKNAPVTEDKALVQITKAFLSGYESKGAFVPKLVVTEYAIKEAPAAATSPVATEAKEGNPFEEEGDAFAEIPDFD